MTRTMDSTTTDSTQHDRYRLWKLGAWLGGILTAGPLVGMILTIAGMLHTSAVIDSERAPTPSQLASGVSIGMYGSAIGMLAGVLGVALLVVSLLKMRSIDRDAERAREEQFSR